jgi:hypothetical protein
LKWLRDILQREKVLDKTENLKFSDLDAWLEERRINSNFEGFLQKTYDKIDEIALDLVKNVEALEFAEPDENTPPRLLKAGLAARVEIIKHLESLIRSLAPPENMDIDSVSTYHWNLVKGLERAVLKFSRAYKYMAALFPRESEILNSELNMLSRLMMPLGDEIRNWRKELEEIWFSKELVARVRDEINKISDLRRSTKRNEEILAELQKSNRNLESEIKRFETTKEGRIIEDFKRSLESKSEELKAIDAEILNLVAPLTKALARIVKQGASERISLQHRRVLDLLSTTPIQALDNDVYGALKELKLNLAALGLKDRKKEKIMNHIDFLIDNEPLENLKSSHLRLQKDIKIIEQQLSKSCNEVNLLKEELSRAKKEMKGLEVELDQSRQALTDVEKRYSVDMAELKERLQKIAGKPVVIDLPEEINWDEGESRRTSTPFDH